MKPRTAQSRSALVVSPEHPVELDGAGSPAQAACVRPRAWRYRWRASQGAAGAWSIWHYTESDPRHWREVPDHIQALDVVEDIRKEHFDGTGSA